MTDWTPDGIPMMAYIPSISRSKPIRIGSIIQTCFRDWPVVVVAMAMDNDSMALTVEGKAISTPPDKDADKEVEYELVRDRIIVYCQSAHMICFETGREPCVPVSNDEPEADQPIGHEPKGQDGG